MPLPKAPQRRSVVTYRDGSVRIATREALDRWVRRGGWDSLEEFERQCGVTAAALVGKRFIVLANRCFFGGA